MCANYRIYPSLLDSFQRYLDSAKEFEDVWNVDADGEYKRSLEEIEAEREQDLLDSINRVPRPASEAQDKGTAFNELIDWEARRTPTREGLYFYNRNCQNGFKTYEVKFNGWEWVFNGRDIDRWAPCYASAVPQYLCKATIDTKRGPVLLYGYADEICQDVVVDLKTTTRYNFGKFEHGWQKSVYPYCLVASGDMPSVSRFEYHVYVWREKKGDPISVDRYVETYDYDHEKNTQKLRAFVETFCDWLEEHRDKITDKKIFGL